MIVVIADDLSGAAELANAAVAAGYSAEVHLCASAPPFFLAGFESDVVCLDTDTRSFAPETAGKIAGEIARGLAAIRTTLVYKKCDSVLRGAVAAESLAIARALGRKRVLLVPANPSRRRIIRNGEYFVDGVPLAQTPFASDLEHPCRSSRVTELLGHAPGFETPDTVSAADLDRHAANVDNHTLPAGGVDFFQAVLKAKFPSVTRSRAAVSAAPPQGSSLFVCGSPAAWLAGRSDVRRPWHSRFADAPRAVQNGVARRISHPLGEQRRNCPARKRRGPARHRRRTTQRQNRLRYARRPSC